MEPVTRDKVSINIKGIPARLRDDLARRAARSHRSLNREILHILETAVEERGADDWPEGFLQRFAGALVDAPIAREDQGGYETREGLR